MLFMHTHDKDIEILLETLEVSCDLVHVLSFRAVALVLNVFILYKDVVKLTFVPLRQDLQKEVRGFFRRSALSIVPDDLWQDNDDVLLLVLLLFVVKLLRRSSWKLLKVHLFVGVVRSTTCLCFLSQLALFKFSKGSSPRGRLSF